MSEPGGPQHATADGARLRLPPWPVLAAGGVVVALALGVALYLFQPWRVFTTRTVDEALPVAASPAPATTAVVPATTASPPPTTGPATTASPATTPAAPPATTAAPAATAAAPPATTAAPPAAQAPAPAVPEIVELARGDLISHEHSASGTARLLQLADGSRVLRIEGLDTSDGPDLRVWLTDAPVIEGRDGWFVFDDGRYVDLGELKGNVGDANYPVPPEADIEGLTSVSVWCRRFAVSFGAAELTPA